MLPLIGSVAAVVTGAVAYRQEPGESRHLATVGLVLGVLGVLAPVLFLFVYCVLLGYPFPIHRFRPAGEA